MSTNGSRLGRRARWLLPLLVAAVAVSVYAGTLGHGFVFDDHQLIEDNERLAEPGYASYLLFKTRLWRPVTVNLLKFIRLAIGPESPIEQAAIARLHRAGLMKDGEVVRRNS